MISLLLDATGLDVCWAFYAVIFLWCCPSMSPFSCILSRDICHFWAAYCSLSSEDNVAAALSGDGYSGGLRDLGHVGGQHYITIARSDLNTSFPLPKRLPKFCYLYITKCQWQMIINNHSA